MKNPKVGERIRVYGVGITAKVADGYIDSVDEMGGTFKVDLDDGTWILAHPKCCRRLKPKAKRVAREVHLTFKPDGAIAGAYWSKQEAGPVVIVPGWTQAKFREVLDE